MDDAWFEGCMRECGQEIYGYELESYRGLQFDRQDMVLGSGMSRESLTDLERVGLLSTKERRFLSAVLLFTQMVGTTVFGLVPGFRDIKLPTASADFFIFRGKRTVKVLNIADEIVINLPASAEDNPYLEKEVQLREEVDGLVSTPETLQASLTDGKCPFFIEPQIKGQQFPAYSQLENADLLEEVTRDLFRWYGSQRPSQAASIPYAEELINEIESQSPFHAANEKPRVLLDRIQKSLQGVPVQIIQCHGDFNRKNLIKSGSSYYLIDWELSDDRSLLFDIFTFGFNAAIFDSDVGYLEAKIYQGGLLDISKPLVQEADLTEYGLIFMIEKLHLLAHEYEDTRKAITRLEDWSEVFLSEFDQIISAA